MTNLYFKKLLVTCGILKISNYLTYLQQLMFQDMTAYIITVNKKIIDELQ